MVCVVPGVILAAAYMLRMLQKVAYGGTRNPDHSGLKDLGLREILTLAPLLVFVFWIGLHPEPFTRVMHASMQNLLAQTHQANQFDGYALVPQRLEKKTASHALGTSLPQIALREGGRQ
jgi:NADH-quinone oxidoreductase subunit M